MTDLPTQAPPTPLPIVSVRGEATLEVEPEVAFVYAHVTVRAGEQAKVTASLSERSNSVRDITASYGSAIERVESGQIAIRPEFDNKKTEHVRRYVGTATTRIVVVGFDVLPELLADLNEVKMISVDGPGWQLRPDSPVYREARLAAAHDAQRRAQDYAEAFGSRLVGLLEVADLGMSSDVAPQPAFGARATAMAARASSESQTLALTPAHQRVTGHVEARFLMAQPDSVTPATPERTTTE